MDEALDRIEANPFQYAIAFADARQAPLKKFKYSLWYRILPDHGLVVACLAQRCDVSLARRRFLKIEP